MKILFLSRSTLFSQPGGDTLQIEQTASYLRKAGYQIDIKVNGDKFDLRTYDLIHFFNLIRPADARDIISSEVPLIVSSIYHDYSEYDARHRRGLSGFLFALFGKFGLEYIKTTGRWLNGSDRFPGWSYIWKGQKKSMIYILKKTSHLISTSFQEAELIQKDLGALPPYSKINLGSEHFEDVDSNKSKTGVLCAARIEGPKNQLKLIRALKNEPFSLIITGKPAHNQISYYNECKKAAGNNVTFTGQISRSELNKKFSESKVHALISYYETTGLSTIEALKAGCQVVITERGAQKEIFGDRAFYCDPDNIKSIRKAVKQALSKEGDHRQWVKENFRWEQAARKISDIYKALPNIQTSTQNGKAEIQ